jgi:alpha-amylase/alpha-mannosidase (GH57 family)
MNEKCICIHGHFYQPPRENAWLEEVELQDSAYPYHDWNERITAECYAPNTASRILDDDGRIIDIVNNYSRISFNFGPSLLSWMERKRPETYNAILEADRLSMENFSGHGSAIAQVYNHMIMPLANRRDRYTQVIWGIRDFESRFRRFPEGMWLPETAVDIPTLEVMAELGIPFTVLAPRQARKIRKLGRGSRWQDVGSGNIDPTRPYTCRLPSGKSIAVFFYDNPISRDVAFGGLLGSGEEFARRLMSAFSDVRKHPQLVHIATDGETYGHHHRGGDMALTYCLNDIESKKLARLTNYGEYLENHPPTYEVAIFENSAWSCIHGIDRWRDNCGCHSGMNPEWTQEWRRPLREALDDLRFSIIEVFEKGTHKFFHDPWGARDDYISLILNRSEENIENFLRAHCMKKLSRKEKVVAMKYLEMQRHAMLMYTSCGWFFDEISGMETVQIMQYASMTMQLAAELQGKDLETDFLSILESARSNVYENGAAPYELFVRPARVNLLRVGAHYSISSIFHDYSQQADIYCYTAKSQELNVKERDREKLVFGKARIISNITLEERTFIFSVLYRGYQKVTAGIKEFPGDIEYAELYKKTGACFDRGDMDGADAIIQKNFTGNIFSLSHLFLDEQRKIIDQILQLSYEGIYSSCRQIYDNYYDIMDFFQTLNVPLPKPFRTAVEHITNRDLTRFFKEDGDSEKLETITKQIKKWSIEFDAAAIRFIAGSRITSLMESLSNRAEDTFLINKIETILKLAQSINLDMDLWKAQNIFLSIAKGSCKDRKGRAEKGDAFGQKWLDAFHQLGQHLHVKVPF